MRERGRGKVTERDSACVCFAQHSVYTCLHMDWTSPDAECRNGLSPAFPRRCTHKADMAQPKEQKHTNTDLTPLLLTFYFAHRDITFFCCHFIVHTNCNKFSLFLADLNISIVIFLTNFETCFIWLIS